MNPHQEAISDEYLLAIGISSRGKSVLSWKTKQKVWMPLTKNKGLKCKYSDLCEFEASLVYKN